jgi:hypothetical protein
MVFAIFSLYRTSVFFHILVFPVVMRIIRNPFLSSPSLFVGHLHLLASLPPTQPFLPSTHDLVRNTAIE